MDVNFLQSRKKSRNPQDSANIENFVEIEQILKILLNSVTFLKIYHNKNYFHKNNFLICEKFQNIS